MKRGILLLGFFGLLFPSASRAQDKRLEAVIAQHVYSPWMVMEHQTRLNLSEEQRATIIEKMEVAEREVLPSYWELEERIQSLVEVVSGERVEMEAAMARFDEVTVVESRIKRRHMELLLEVKNLLNAEQQATLREIVQEVSRREGGGEVG